MKRKKPFVLLELMIALILFALCIVPLIEIPLRALKNEYLMVTRLNLHRLSDLAFAEIKTQLYAQEIPWKDLGHEKKDKVLLSEQKVKIDKTELNQRCYAWSSSTKPGKKDAQARLVTIEVEFSHPSSPLFLVKRKLKKSKVFQYEVCVNRSANSTVK